jgi:hypothetical protein
MKNSKPKNIGRSSRARPICLRSREPCKRWRAWLRIGSGGISVAAASKKRDQDPCRNLPFFIDSDLYAGHKAWGSLLISISLISSRFPRRCVGGDPRYRHSWIQWSACLFPGRQNTSALAPALRANIANSFLPSRTSLSLKAANPKFVYLFGDPVRSGKCGK